MTSQLRLDGQTAVVTGASSGIGRFAAKLLARHGARVALVARRHDRLLSLAEEIRADGGIARGYQLDLSEATAIDAVVGIVENDLGPISLLINNAGVYLLKDALSATAEDLDRLYTVNVRGAFLVAQSVGRRMIAAGISGRIVNLGSIAGLRAMPELGVYGMSKAHRDDGRRPPQRGGWEAHSATAAAPHRKGGGFSRRPCCSSWRRGPRSSTERSSLSTTG